MSIPYKQKIVSFISIQRWISSVNDPLFNQGRRKCHKSSIPKLKSLLVKMSCSFHLVWSVSPSLTQPIVIIIYHTSGTHSGPGEEEWMKQNPCSHRAYNLEGAGATTTDPHINKQMQVSEGDKCWEGKKKNQSGKAAVTKGFPVR